jgi:hypothetical protein
MGFIVMFVPETASKSPSATQPSSKASSARLRRFAAPERCTAGFLRIPGSRRRFQLCQFVLPDLHRRITAPLQEPAALEASNSKSFKCFCKLLLGGYCDATSSGPKQLRTAPDLLAFEELLEGFQKARALELLYKGP